LLLSVLSGEDAQAAQLLLEFQRSGSEDPQDLSAIELAQSAAAAHGGEYAEALAHGTRALERGQTFGPGHDGIRWGWPIAADAALALRDQAAVTRLIEWLDNHPTGHMPPVLRAERLRVRARLLSLNGDQDADRAFEAAVTALRELASPYHLAAGLLDHAEHLVSAGDAETARRLADEARTVAARLGAKPLIDRIDRLRVHAGVGPAALTQ
jgi:hypothetical protein